MAILITGSTGKLGQEAVKIFRDSLHPTHKELDIINKKQVFDFVGKHNPDVIMHLAALVPIRECEEKKELAWKTNIEGTKNLLAACSKFNKKCYFAYMSTPCVFSGENGPYNELSLPYPKHFYGLTKLIAESLVLNSNLERKIILRANFVPKSRWPYPKAFTDRYSNYLFADDAAKAIKEVVDAKVTGILHICGSKVMSMYDLAKLTTPDIGPMMLAEYDGPQLTVDMRLNTIYPKWKRFNISAVE